MASSSDISDQQTTKMPRLEEQTIDVKSLTSHLDCSLCLSLICEPISISCGHSFCRVCLVKALRRHKKQCPSCREVCHVSAENAAENIMIKAMAMSLDSDTYKARLAETEAEKSSWTALYPIFYYNSTMFPGNKLSLVLFEPRYKLMMRRIIDTTRSFAYVPNFTNYHARAGDIALVVELKEVEFLADGRCILEGTLTSRHRIVEHYIEQGTQNLHYCRLESYRDEGVKEEEKEEVEKIVRELRNFVKELSKKSSGRIFEESLGTPPQDVENFSLWLLSLSPLDEREKMSWLLSRLSLPRLQRLAQVFGGMRTAGTEGGGERGASSRYSRLTSFLSTFFSAGGGGGGAAEAGAQEGDAEEGEGGEEAEGAGEGEEGQGEEWEDMEEEEHEEEEGDEEAEGEDEVEDTEEELAAD